MSSEAAVKQKIKLALGSLPHVRVFNNPCGFVIAEDGRRITYGLFPGSSDLVGWRSIVVTESMIGARVAVFVGAEIKTESGRIRPNQLVWQAQVRKFGGIAEILRSTEDARLITEWEPRV